MFFLVASNPLRSGPRSAKSTLAINFGASHLSDLQSLSSGVNQALLDFSVYQIMMPRLD